MILAGWDSAVWLAGPGLFLGRAVTVRPEALGAPVPPAGGVLPSSGLGAGRSGGRGGQPSQCEDHAVSRLSSRRVSRSSRGGA